MEKREKVASGLIQRITNSPEILLPDRPIAFNRDFVRLGIGVTGALFLSQCLYWSKRTKDSDGWFHKTREHWEEETGLSIQEQRSLKKKLVDKGFLEIEKRGVPARNYFRVDQYSLALSLAKLTISHDKSGGINSTSSVESTLLDGLNQQHIYSESTTESTSKNGDAKASRVSSSKPLKGKMKISPLNPAHNTLRPLVIKALEPLHPLEARRWYANTTEGKAVDALIDWLGEKKLMRFAEVWPTAVKEAFAPQAYKPSAILAKWPQIEKFLIERKKSGKTSAPAGGEATMGRLAEMMN